MSRGALQDLPQETPVPSTHSFSFEVLFTSVDNPAANSSSAPKINELFCTPRLGMRRNTVSNKNRMPPTVPSPKIKPVAADNLLFNWLSMPIINGETVPMRKTGKNRIKKPAIIAAVLTFMLKRVGNTLLAIKVDVNTNTAAPASEIVSPFLAFFKDIRPPSQ